MKMCVVFFHLKKNRKYFLEIFQIDITSSDLDEFWIGCKFWKAENLLYSDPEGELGKWIRLRERSK